MSARPAVRQAYRHLLRAASAATRYSRPAARSVRQLLRADVEATVRHGPSDPQCAAEHTMTLLLLSALHNRPVHGPAGPSGESWVPSSVSDASALAHKLVHNLASLSYHHLSPNTQMQPKARRAGGTTKSTALQRPSAVARALAEDEDGTPPESQVQVERPGLKLSVLRVAPKPVRGPVGHRPEYWDGQHPEKHLRAAEGGEEQRELDAVERRIKHLGEALTASNEEHGRDHPESTALHSQLIEMRGTLKAIRRAQDRRLAEERLAQRPIAAMEQVASALADQEALWIGAARWQQRRRGEWLPP